MKNSESTARRQAARKNIPKGWRAVPRNKKNVVQKEDRAYDPVNCSFIGVSRSDIGRAVEDFYCVIRKISE